VRVNVIIIDGDMEKPTISDKCRNYKLGTNRKTEMTMNDTTPNLTICTISLKAEVLLELKLTGPK